MKKLFTAIRQGDLKTVKATLNNYPEAVNEPAKAPPKKDDGLSPLQVALKTGEFDIAKYLIEQGADVNYMDPFVQGNADEWSTPVLQDAIGAVFFALQDITDIDDAEEELEVVEKATEIVREILERGADPNKLSYRTYTTTGGKILEEKCDAIDRCLIGACEVYEELWDPVSEKLIEMLDLLLKHGADIEAWANLADEDGETNRSRYIDDFVPVPDKTVEVIHRGYSIIPIDPANPVEPKKGDRRETVVIHGDVDHNAEWRAFMQEFCRKRGLLGLK